MANTISKAVSLSRFKTTMLYCPKCQQTYDEGVQRFCLTDGGRLLPAPSSGKSVSQTNGVFSGVINRKNTEENDEFANAPRLSELKYQTPSSKILKSEIEAVSEPKVSKSTKSETLDEFDFELELEILVPNTSAVSEPLLEIETELESAPILESPILEEEKELAPEIDLQSPVLEKEQEIAPEIDLEQPKPKPVLRLVNPDEITNGSAALGDRKINPAGRKAISWENPQVLLGHAVKGRYNVLEQIGLDENAIYYLAEDKINHGKQIVVRVLMDEDSGDSFSGKIFAEERTALSHIDHPNVVRVIDSGELLEGKPFIVTEYIKGESIESRLERKGRFDAVRTARIIRQASYALSEVHQGGILHRNLKPENIILTVSDIGAEQVKLINFGTSKGILSEKNLLYKSPEQVEGKLANFASDEFALAVIAYQMLTDRLPFNANKIGALLKEQREGLIIRAATLNDTLPPLVDEILAKALSFNPADRYPKARDFGDALFNAVTTKLPAAGTPELVEATPPIPAPDAPLILKGKQSVILKPVNEQVEKKETLTETVPGKVKATEDLAWEKRSPELPIQNNGSRTSLGLLGLAVLVVGLFGIWYYFVKHQNDVKIAAPTPVQSVVPIDNADNSSASTVNNPSPTPEDIETPPIQRTVTQPPDTKYFQNSKSELTGDPARNFLGFSLYYPQSWKLNETKNNFLDVSKTSENNLPIEQMLISYYDSKGTFRSDRELFPKLLEKSNVDLKKALGNYKIISQGETNIQNGRWQAFEVKFESLGTAPNGEKITLWGRRLWIPSQFVGLKNGYVITMLATSLSPDVKSVEDVGVKGELSNILETFEPNQNL